MPNSYTGSFERLYVCGLLIVVLIAAILAELLIRFFGAPKDDFFVLVEKVRNEQSDFIVLGDSQIEYAFRGDYPLNLSIGGLSYLSIEVVLEEYFRENSNLQKVILTVSPQMFSPIRVGQGDLGLAELIGLHSLGNSWYPRVFEARSRNTLGKVFAKERKDANWSDVKESRRLSLMRKRLDWQAPVEGFLATDQFAAFERLLDVLDQKKIDLCLIYPPVSQEFWLTMNRDDRYVQFWDSLLSYLESKGEDVIFQNQIDYLFSNDQFVNQDHLNDLGATIFEKKIIDKCSFEI